MTEDLFPFAEKYLSVDALSENMPGAFLIYKAGGGEEILFASRALTKIFECDSMAEFMKFTGGSFATLVYPEDIEKVNQAVWDQVSASDGYDYVQYRVITKNGNIKTVEDWGHLVHDEDLNEDIFYVYLNDIKARSGASGLAVNSEKKPDGANRAPSAAERYAEIDELTGLANIKSFRLHAPEYIKKFIDAGKYCYCVYFNIRNFHTYNETYGFAGGDRMLKSIARILQDTFLDSLVARFNKDHFVLIIGLDADDSGDGHAELIARINRMGARINNIRRGIIVEMKAGIYYVKDKNNIDVSLMCDYAKLACDSIHREYGTSAQVYDGKMEEKIQLQEYILNNFQTALDNGDIKVFFQPVINVGNDKIASVEALTRWEDKTHGSISPANFIFVLEEQRQIHKLDTFVINKVCEYLHQRRENATQESDALLTVSVNLSRLDFEMTDIVRVIEDAVSEYNIPREMLQFEISESLIAMDMDALKHEADRLRKHGFKVWMDAFGSGYSSLKVLKDFTLDGLKIDMDMIKALNAESEDDENVKGDERANIIISAVIGMAQRLGIPVLSKGVETKEQLEFLKRAGCDLAQGYLLGRPMPPADVENIERSKK